MKQALPPPFLKTYSCSKWDLSVPFRLPLEAASGAVVGEAGPDLYQAVTLGRDHRCHLLFSREPGLPRGTGTGPRPPRWSSKWPLQSSVLPGLLDGWGSRDVLSERGGLWSPESPPPWTRGKGAWPLQSALSIRGGECACDGALGTECRLCVWSS